MARIIRKLPTFTIAPWQRDLTVGPIARLMNAPEDKLKRRTRAWREAKLAELSFVGLMSTFAAAVIATGLSWDGIDRPGAGLVRGAWHSGLLIAVVAAALATQQSIALQRLGSHKGGMKKLRDSLAYTGSSGPKPRPYLVLTWQIPVTLLNISLFIFFVGILIYVYAGYKEGFEGLEVIVPVTIALAFTVTTYAASSMIMYSSMT